MAIAHLFETDTETEAPKPTPKPQTSTRRAEDMTDAELGEALREAGRRNGGKGGRPRKSATDAPGEKRGPGRPRKVTAAPAAETPTPAPTASQSAPPAPPQ